MDIVRISCSNLVCFAAEGQSGLQLLWAKLRAMMLQALTESKTQTRRKTGSSSWTFCSGWIRGSWESFVESWMFDLRFSGCCRLDSSEVFCSQMSVDKPKVRRRLWWDPDMVRNGQEISNEIDGILVRLSWSSELLEYRIVWIIQKYFRVSVRMWNAGFFTRNSKESDISIRMWRSDSVRGSPTGKNAHEQISNTTARSQRKRKDPKTESKYSLGSCVRAHQSCFFDCCFSLKSAAVLIQTMCSLIQTSAAVLIRTVCSCKHKIYQIMCLFIHQIHHSNIS